MAELDWGMAYEPDPRTASPARLAYEAYERGDRWFQIDIILNAIQGRSQVGAAYTRTRRGDEADLIGPIEDQGWDLRHVSTTFVQTGWSSSKRVMSNAGSTEVATHGQLVALYVFQRGERG